MAVDSLARGMASSGVDEAKSYTDTKIADIGNGFNYKGSVATVAGLPATATKGDTYNVQTGGLYAWDGSAWYDVTIKGTAAGFGTPTVSTETGAAGTSAAVAITASGPDTAKVFDFDFTIPRGADGTDGEDGTSAGFGTPTATVDANVGTPSVTITASGPDTAKVFDFQFHNLKGTPGTNSVSVSATGTSTNKVKYITIDGTESKMGMDVINNVTSTETEAALSANMGKELQDQISNLKNIGTFLSLWNCTTGLPNTNPTEMPYTMRVGSYYRIGTVAGTYTHTVSMSGIDEENDSFSVQFSFTDSTSTAYTTVADLSDALYAQGHTAHSGTCPATGSAGEWNIGYVASDAGTNILLQDSTTSAKGTVLDSATGITINDTVTGSNTNYRPDGGVYSGTASTVVETEDVEVGGVYYWDGNAWVLQKSGGGGTVQDVQINGTSILDLGSGIANIPRATASAEGVAKFSNSYGMHISGGYAYPVSASQAKITARASDANGSIMPSNFDFAVKAALTDGVGTAYTTAEQAAARNTIGAGTVTDVQVNGTTVTSSGVANIPIASSSTLGVVKAAVGNGTYIESGSGVMTINKSDDAKLVAKTNNYCPVVPSNLDKAVMEGLGNNSLTWSDAYKSSARTTIGAGVPITIEFLGSDE